MSIENQLDRIEQHVEHLHYMLHDLMLRQSGNADSVALVASTERLRASAEALTRAIGKAVP
jgi:hypothetical protein